MTYWDEFYKTFTRKGPSNFVRWVDEHLDVDCPVNVVADLGCGTGDDSRFFANTGRTVFPVDASQTAIASLLDSGQPLLNPLCANIAGHEVWEILAEQHPSVGNMLFYGRFLFHSLEPKLQTLVLASITEIARPGDLLALEYRTLADAAIAKIYQDHMRYFVDHKAVLNSLRATGWEILEDSEGQGMAPYLHEDPVIGRILARSLPNRPK